MHRSRFHNCKISALIFVTTSLMFSISCSTLSSTRAQETSGSQEATESQNSASPYQSGMASWYGGRFQGRPTASGELFDKRQMTAAHPKLPFGTIVTVESIATGKSVTVRINDRGPFVRGRIIDLSEAAARKLGMIDKGHEKVAIYLDNE